MREYDTRNVENEENKIDIIQGIVKGWKCFKKTWWLLLILAAAGVGIAGVYRLFFFRPVYTASSSFTVNAGGDESSAGSYSSQITLEQMTVERCVVVREGPGAGVAGCGHYGYGAGKYQPVSDQRGPRMTWISLLSGCCSR